MTGILADEIYDYSENKKLLPEEQKGCRRKCKETGDLLFIDKMISSWRGYKVRDIPG